MILSQTASIRLTNLLVNRYKNLGYVDAKSGNILTVKIADLSSNSRVNILCECDNCNSKFITEYRLLSKANEILCKSCKLSLSAKKRIQKFGSNFSNSEIQRKIATKYQNDPIKLKQISESRKSTKLKKYNDSAWNNQEKRLKTIKNKGVIDWNNSKKRKETTKLIHGNETWNNQEKKQQTCLLKYGVRHTQQVNEIFNKTCKFKKYFEILYQGSFELHFLQTFYDKIKIVRGPSFKYTDSAGKNRIYYADFLIPSLNLIIEIKSKYTFDKDKNRNLKKDSTVKEGYNFLCLIDKQYNELLDLIKLNEINNTES